MARTTKSRPSTKKPAVVRAKASANASAQGVRIKNRLLRDLTEEALTKYFKDLNGHRPGDLYDLVLGEVEEPLFKAALDYARGNQSVAAEMLGINRATLRKKLRYYHLVN